MKSLVDNNWSQRWQSAGSGLFSLSGILEFMIVVIALFDLVLLVTMDIPVSVDAVEIYLRYSSSVAALLILACFFARYYRFHYEKSHHHMRSLKKASFLLFIAGVVKVIISGFYLAYCLADNNLVLLFYVGEILVWSMVTLFAFLYYRRMSGKRTSGK